MRLEMKPAVPESEYFCRICRRYLPLAKFYRRSTDPPYRTICKDHERLAAKQRIQKYRQTESGKAASERRLERERAMTAQRREDAQTMLQWVLYCANDIHKSGYTWTQVARYLGVRPQTLLLWRSGRRFPRYESIYQPYQRLLTMPTLAELKREGKA